MFFVADEYALGEEGGLHGGEEGEEGVASDGLGGGEEGDVGDGDEDAEDGVADDLVGGGQGGGVAQEGVLGGGVDDEIVDCFVGVGDGLDGRDGEDVFDVVDDGLAEVGVQVFEVAVGLVVEDPGEGEGVGEDGAGDVDSVFVDLGDCGRGGAEGFEDDGYIVVVGEGLVVHFDHEVGAGDYLVSHFLDGFGTEEGVLV